MGHYDITFEHKSKDHTKSTTVEARCRKHAIEKAYSIAVPNNKNEYRILEIARAKVMFLFPHPLVDIKELICLK